MQSVIPPILFRKCRGLCAALFFITCATACATRGGESSSTWRQDTVAWPASFEIGRPATAKEIEDWNIDASPNGEGLPAGQGTVARGRVIYAAKCITCHGPTGSEGPFDRLVDKHTSDTTKKTSPSGKSIGSYWPYATTVYDYIHRAMPLTEPGSLTPDEVYSLTAFLLHANGIIDSTQTIDAKTLPQVSMPAQKRFVPDDRTGGPEVR